MKTLPILSASLMALTGLTCFVGVQNAQKLLAQESTATQPETAEPDAAETPPEEKPVKVELPPENPEALAVLKEARQLLFDRSSVQAKLRETIRMGGRRFQAEGEYFAGQFPKLRLHIKIDAADTQAELLEICDGHILWTVQKLASSEEAQPQEQVSRTVIADVMEAWNESLNVEETQLIASMGVGGLPSLLAALQRSMTFEVLRELESDGVSYSVIQGRWNDELRARYKQEGTEQVEFPVYVPDHVRIYFDAETRFPTRILYLKETEPGSGQRQALLSLEFWDVVLDGPVNEDLFHYTPAELTQVRDRTRDFLEMMKSAAASATDTESAAPEGAQPVDEQ